MNYKDVGVACGQQLYSSGAADLSYLERCHTDDRECMFVTYLGFTDLGFTDLGFTDLGFTDLGIVEPCKVATLQKPTLHGSAQIVCIPDRMYTRNIATCKLTKGKYQIDMITSVHQHKL